MNMGGVGVKSRGVGSWREAMDDERVGVNEEVEEGGRRGRGEGWWERCDGRGG